MEAAIDRIYRAYRLGLRWIVGYGAAIVMLGGTGLAILEIIRRYLFGSVYNWGQDAVTFFIAGSVFLFFAVTQARRSHLAMTALLEALRDRGYVRTVLAIRAFISAISLAFFSTFAWWGADAVAQTMARGRVTQSMVFYVWPFQLCLAIGFALMAVAAVFQLYQDIQALRGKNVFPWAPVEEGLDI